MEPDSQPWLLLIISPPDDDGALQRLRIWQTLDAMGCALLRDGVYLLPSNAWRRQALAAIAEAVIDAGGRAFVLDDGYGYSVQDDQFRRLFDRSPAYARVLAAINQARVSMLRLHPSEVRQKLQLLQREYDLVRAIDYFPNEASRRADAEWREFNASAEALMRQGAPTLPGRR